MTDVQIISLDPHTALVLAVIAGVILWLLSMAIGKFIRAVARDECWAILKHAEMTKPKQRRNRLGQWAKGK